MKYLCLLLVCCLAGIRQTSAACSTASMSSFNEAAFLDVWYKVGSSISTTDTCMKYTFIAGTGQLKYKLIKGTGLSQGTWTPFSTPPGKYTDEYPSGSGSTTVITIIATDYVSYAVEYICITISTVTRDIYNLYSRTPNSFTVAKTSAGTAIPSTVTMYPINNNCPTGTIKDLFLSGKR